MRLNKFKVNKILVVSLTNIGDVILTLPVVDILKRDFPEADISIVIGPKAESLFNQNPHLKNVYIYDKKQSKLKTIQWVLSLRKEKFDLVVDLRNTMIPFLIRPRYRTPAAKIKTEHMHMREKHLDRLKTVYPYETTSDTRFSLFVHEDDKKYIRDIIRREITLEKKYIVVAPGAAYHAKRWRPQGYAQLCDRIIQEFQVAVIFVGDEKDEKTVDEIVEAMESTSVNLVGQTTLIQMAELMQWSEMVISNDSAPMHMASYMNKPVLALFGPSSPGKYGPWSQNAHFIKAQTEQPVDEDNVINAITVQEVFESIRFENGAFNFKL